MKSPARIITIGFTVVVFLVALGLALSNTQATSVRFFLFGDDAKVTAPLVVWLSLFFMVGVVVGLVSSWPARWRQRRAVSALEKQVRELKAAVAQAGAVAARSGTEAASAPKGLLKRLGT